MTLKKFKTTFIWSIIIIWLPVMIDLFFWNKLPSKIVTHYNAQMVPNGWSPKPVAVFMLPIILTIVQIFLVYLFIRDPKNKNAKVWMNNIILMVIPVISVFINVLMLSTGLGFNVARFKDVFFNFLAGIILIMLGIVLKSVKPNQIIGIRLPWTLHSSENWKRTHQLTSELFIIGGIVMLVIGLTPLQLLFVPILLLLIIVPVIYSFILFKRGI